MNKIISGIQQIGIGVKDLQESWKWYNKYFKMNVCIFEEEAVAEFMLHYTNGQPRKRHALLAINMHGGGGFEIWQHKDKEPTLAKESLNFGDLGINVCKMKTHKIKELYNYFKTENLNLVTELITSIDKRLMFYMQDPWGNYFQFIEEKNVFLNDKNLNGGCFGAIIGVSNIEKSLKVYKEILGFDKIICDVTAEFDDLKNLNGGTKKFRRVIIEHSAERKGAFSELLGPAQIELIESLDSLNTKKIFENRIWGDPGFIHLCFDIRNMQALKEECKNIGHNFTVDSSEAINKTFDMGDASGNFAYISDPDGTPIEFVETFKIPLFKKFGLYIKLSKKNPEKKLPKWMLRFLKFQKRNPNSN